MLREISPFLRSKMNRPLRIPSVFFSTSSATLPVFTLITLGLRQQINSIFFRLEIQKRVFSRVGEKIWNEMPASLRELPKKHFQTKLHSFLLDILKKHGDYIDISQEFLIQTYLITVIELVIYVNVLKILINDLVQSV